MATFITLVRLSGEAMKSMGGIGSAYKEGMNMAQQMGIKLIGAYATLGSYDAVFIYEAPDEKIAAAMALSIAAKQGGRTETWTAFPMEEFTKLAARLTPG